MLRCGRIYFHKLSDIAEFAVGDYDYQKVSYFIPFVRKFCIRTLRSIKRLFFLFHKLLTIFLIIISHTLVLSFFCFWFNLCGGNVPTLWLATMDNQDWSDIGFFLHASHILERKGSVRWERRERKMSEKRGKTSPADENARATRPQRHKTFDGWKAKMSQLLVVCLAFVYSSERSESHFL